MTPESVLSYYAYRKVKVVEEVKKEEKKEEKKKRSKKKDAYVALSVKCPFPRCHQPIDVIDKILPLYSETYQKVLKDNALEEYKILTEEEPDLLEGRKKLQIESNRFLLMS